MIGLLIKKAFFDGWDNLISIIIMNLGFILCLAIVFFLPYSGEQALGGFAIFLTIPGIFISHIYAGTISLMLKEISDFHSFGFDLVKKGFLGTWKASLVLAVINSGVFIVIIIAFPFYLSMGSFIGVAGAGLVFWISFFWLLSCQYFFPVYTRMKGNIFISLKKSLLLSLDNPGFSIFLFLYSAVLLVLSVVTALIMPGFTGILLFHQNAVKLRLYKYDWLEENPEGNRKKIPWDVLLQDDREKIGPRSIKGMIFPWKE